MLRWCRAAGVGIGAACAGLACGESQLQFGELPPEPQTAPLISVVAESEPEPVPRSYAERLAEIPSDASERATIEALLYSYCGSCHGSDWVARHRTQADGAGMYYVDDVDALIATGKIVPGEPAQSPLLLRILDDSMPPVSSGLPQPPAELRQRISDFIVELAAARGESERSR